MDCMYNNTGKCNKEKDLSDFLCFSDLERVDNKDST